MANSNSGRVYPVDIHPLSCRGHIPQKRAVKQVRRPALDNRKVSPRNWNNEVTSRYRLTPNLVAIRSLLSCRISLAAWWLNPTMGTAWVTEDKPLSFSEASSLCVVVNRFFLLNVRMYWLLLRSWQASRGIYTVSRRETHALWWDGAFEYDQGFKIKEMENLKKETKHVLIEFMDTKSNPISNYKVWQTTRSEVCNKWYLVSW